MRERRSLIPSVGALMAVLLIGRAAGADDSAKTELTKTSVAAPGPERAEAASFGLVGFLRSTAALAPTEPKHWWLRDDVGPHDLATAAHKMWDAAAEDLGSIGGLHLSGVGRGGGRTVGLVTRQNVDTVGKGVGALDLDGFDDRPGGVPGGHAARSPAGAGVRHVPADVIQRIVHSHLGQFGICYDVALRTNPTLAGRVVVKFVIDNAGAVAMASDAGSDLPDADVVGCVVRAMTTLSFPESGDSLVTVVYPLSFRPPEPGAGAGPVRP